VAGAVDEPQILKLVATTVGLLFDVIYMGVSVVTLHQFETQLTDTPVAGDHGEPGALPRGRAVAPLG
jgi:hypothetical protein